MKFSAYAGASFLIALGTVLHAWHTRIDYYPTVVFMTTNKLAQVALGNWALVMALAVGKLTSKTFLGTLRDIEIEVMYENARYAITETCLALTVFRGDLTSVTIALFIQLLFVKAFHWLGQARVEHLEQAGGQSLSSMARLSSLVILNLVVDGFMLTNCLAYVSMERPSVLVLFAFEYAILSIAAFKTATHLILHVADNQMTGAWHGKATCVMLLEFFSEVFKFSFYVIFFLVMFTLYSVPPLHLVRDIYVSFDQLQRRLQAFYRYRQLARTMDDRFPAATDEELQQCEHTCIICRDVMDAGKKLPCSHIFHFQCLRLWLQQQQACPTCRANIPSQPTAATAGANAAAERVAQQQAQAQEAPVGGGGVGAVPVAVPGINAAALAAAGAAAGAAPPPPPPAASSEGATGGGGGSPAAALEGVDGLSSASATVTATNAINLVIASTGDVGSLNAVGVGGRGGVGPGGWGGSGAGFAGLIGDGGNTEMLPAGMPLHAVYVDSSTGTSVRISPDRDSTPVNREPKGAVLLLMGPTAPCGSFSVYGGWVGGPGREGEVRLVDISDSSYGGAGATSPRTDGGEGGVEENKLNLTELVEMLDGHGAATGGESVSGGVGNDGLRHRSVASSSGAQS